MCLLVQCTLTKALKTNKSILKSGDEQERKMLRGRFFLLLFCGFEKMSQFIIFSQGPNKIRCHDFQIS